MPPVKLPPAAASGTPSVTERKTHKQTTAKADSAAVDASPRSLTSAPRGKKFQANPKTLLTLAVAASVPIVKALGAPGAQGANQLQPLKDVDPIKLADEITDSMGALNATAMREKMQQVSVDSLYDAANIASTCRDLIGDKDIQNQLVWLKRCLSQFSGAAELGHEIREPTQREKANINKWRMEFAEHYEPFLNLIRAGQAEPGAVVKPSAVTFDAHDLGGSVTHNIPEKDPVPRMYVIGPNSSGEDPVKHEFVHGHTHDRLLRSFQQSPALQMIYEEAITQFVNRWGSKPNNLYSDYELRKNSDTVTKKLLTKAGLAQDFKDATTTGLQFLEKAMFLLDPEATRKLVDGMYAYAQEAWDDTNSWTERAKNEFKYTTASERAIYGLAILGTAYRWATKRRAAPEQEPAGRIDRPVARAASTEAAQQSTPTQASQRVRSSAVEGLGDKDKQALRILTSAADEGLQMSQTKLGKALRKNTTQTRAVLTRLEQRGLIQRDNLKPTAEAAEITRDEGFGGALTEEQAAALAALSKKTA